MRISSISTFEPSFRNAYAFLYENIPSTPNVEFPVYPRSSRHRHQLFQLLEPVQDDADLALLIFALPLLLRRNKDEPLAIGSDIEFESRNQVHPGYLEQSHRIVPVERWFGLDSHGP